MRFTGLGLPAEALAKEGDPGYTVRFSGRLQDSSLPEDALNLREQARIV